MKKERSNLIHWPHKDHSSVLLCLACNQLKKADKERARTDESSVLSHLQSRVKGHRRIFAMSQFCIRLGIKKNWFVEKLAAPRFCCIFFVLQKIGNHTQVMWAQTNSGFSEPILTNHSKDPGSQTVYVPFSAWFFTSAHTGADPFYSRPLWLHYQPDRKPPPLHPSKEPGI